jgi:hypothetical protein
MLIPGKLYQLCHMPGWAGSGWEEDDIEFYRNTDGIYSDQDISDEDINEVPIGSIVMYVGEVIMNFEEIEEKWHHFLFQAENLFLADLDIQSLNERVQFYKVGK